MTAPTIHQAIAGVMKDVGAVGKDRSNQQQGFKFRGIDDVMNALHAPMVTTRLTRRRRIFEEVA